MERTQLFCEQTDCRAHGGAWVRRRGTGEWIVELEEQTLRFVESGSAPLCPLCGRPLLWPSEQLEGTAPASPEEQARLALWLSALPD